MSILLFIIILGVLVFVHELGHFLAAKAFKIRVDEFGIGFPPRALKLFRWKGTDYTLNWIPFGGFVRIFGENPDDESISGPDKKQSFVHKHPLKQIIVLAAGVTFNAIFAWLLLSLGLMVGFPMPADNQIGLPVEDPQLTIAIVQPGSPAEEAGLQSGDRVTVVSNAEETAVDPTVADLQRIVSSTDIGPVILSYERGEETGDLSITPAQLSEEGPLAIGVVTEEIGILQLNPVHALYEGFFMTTDLVVLITVGTTQFIYDAVVGTADYSQVAGPVGIAGLFNDASVLGAIYVLSLTALISLHLAVINLFPFPALDGGRILVVIVEWIRGKTMSPKVVNAINGIGFVLLILLMVVITVSDVVKLF